MLKDYPRRVFSINEDVTRRNMEFYNHQVDRWYAIAEQLYPNYFKLGLRDRLSLKQKIDEVTGYSL